MYMHVMQNVSELLAVWSSDAELSRDIGVPYPTIAAWKQRGSVPPAYLGDIIQAARRRGHPEITSDLLVRLHARKRRTSSAPGFAEEQSTPLAEEGPAAPPADDSEDARSPAGHFSRWKHLRRSHFASRSEIAAHVDALRDEWNRR
jgi:hypothetical protein